MREEIVEARQELWPQEVALEEVKVMPVEEEEKKEIKIKIPTSLKRKVYF